MKMWHFGNTVSPIRDTVDFEAKISPPTFY